LPLLYFEATPALFVGCILANILSGYGVYDIAFGSLATLGASFLTFLIGWIFRTRQQKRKDKLLTSNLFQDQIPEQNALFGKKERKENILQLFLGGIPPILLNSFIIPAIIILTSTSEGYWMNVLTIAASETICVFVLGIPLTLLIKKLKSKLSFLN